MARQQEQPSLNAYFGCGCRFRSMVQPRPAVVSIMADGSVMVTTAGMEMGQGMFTKVKQVCSLRGL